MTSEPTPQLHPDTNNLVNRFAVALKEKLLVAQIKYGYGSGWQDADWADKCRADLAEHVQKGDPRDVAAYAAFAWHHGWSTAPQATEPATQTTCTACETTDELNTCVMCDAPICDDHTLWDDDDYAYCVGCADRTTHAAAAQALGVLADLARQHEAGTLTLAGFSATLGSLSATDLDNIAEYLA